MKKLVLSMMLMVFAISLFAEPVDMDKATRIAKNAYYQKLNTYVGPIDMSRLTISVTDVLEQDGQKLIYAFSFDNYGTIFIAADDAIEPIIGYNFNSQYDARLLPQNFRGLLAEYESQIEFLKDNQIEATPEIMGRWNALNSFNPGSFTPEKGSKNIEPLLTATWNQDWPYNFYCPEDAAGPGDHVYVGCVATAMSQIMHYWRYPLQGSGSHSYYHPQYGTITANFGATSYHWDEMLDNSDQYVNEAMALIGFQAGVGVDMDYGPDGSGAYSDDVPYALRTYFNYDNSVSYKYRQNYQLSAWKNLVSYELDDACPVYYSGQSPDGGHAFVLDGSHTGDDTYHFNFGWSGYMNGWFLITNAGGFTSQQGMVINIVPDDPAYPYGCTPDYELTNLVGSVVDGSGPMDQYDANADCSWIINPQTEQDSVSYIKLKCILMDTDNDDVVTIYDGETTAAEVLATWSGAATPPDDIYSSGNKMLITFVANGDATVGTGWKLEYQAYQPSYCNGLVTFTDDQGSFDDGSGSFWYNANTNCMWKIEPENASDLSLIFTAFDTEEGGDIVKVYDAGNNQLLGEFSGSTIPDPIVIASGKAFVTFQSNGYENHSGWAVDWEIGNVKVMEQSNGFKQFKAYPNPVTDELTVSLTTIEAQDIVMDLLTVTGELVYTQNQKEVLGSYLSRISTADLASGIYFLRLTTNRGTLTEKIVVE